MDSDEVVMRIARLEKDVSELRQWRAEVDPWRMTVDDRDAAIADMVRLFRAIESGLWLFVKFGNGLKWVIGMFVSVAAPGAALWYWLKEHWK